MGIQNKPERCCTYKPCKCVNTEIPNGMEHIFKNERKFTD